MEGLWSLSTVGPHVIVNVLDVPCRIHVTAPQDRMSFERNRHVVLFLAESDPVCFVDVVGERSSSPRTALAGPECVADIDAAPLWIE
jgi:hypothetical protein